MWIGPVAFLMLAAITAVSEAFLSNQAPSVPVEAGQVPRTTGTNHFMHGVGHVPPGSSTQPAQKNGDQRVGLAPLETYLRALADGEHALALSVSSGPAQTYVEYLVALDGILADEGPGTSSLKLIDPPGPGTQLTDGRMSLGGTAEIVEEHGRSGFLVSNFVLRRGPAGTWRVDSYQRDGIDIGNLVTLGDAALVTEANDVVISVIYTFLQPGPPERPHTLVLLYRIDNRRRGAVSVFPYGATFEPWRAGKVIEAEFMTDQVAVPPQASAEDLLFIQPGDLKGRIVGEVHDLDTQAIWTIELSLSSPSADE